MCLAPITIKNVNEGGHAPLGYKPIKDYKSAYIQVPCGKCAECIKAKQMAIVQRVQMEGLNSYIYYSTLTYNNLMIPKIEVNGHEIKYAEWGDIQNMMKRIRKQGVYGNRRFKYMAVSEFGTLKGRPHFHILWFVEKKEKDDKYTSLNIEHSLYKQVFNQWCRNEGTNRKPKYVQCFTYTSIWSRGQKKTNFDLHLVERNMEDGVNSVAFYVCKYMMKPSERERKLEAALKINLDEERFNEIWKKIRPRKITSKNFGWGNWQEPGTKKEIAKNVQEYIEQGIDKADINNTPYPSYFNEANGKSFPLAKLYKEKFVKYEQAERFYYRTHDEEGNLLKEFETRKDVEARRLEKGKNVENELFKKTDIFDEIDESIEN